MRHAANTTDDQITLTLELRRFQHFIKGANWCCKDKITRLRLKGDYALKTDSLKSIVLIFNKTRLYCANCKIKDNYLTTTGDFPVSVQLIRALILFMVVLASLALLPLVSTKLFCSQHVTGV